MEHFLFGFLQATCLWIGLISVIASRYDLTRRKSNANHTQSAPVPACLVAKAKDRLDQIDTEMRSIGHASPNAISEIRIVLDALPSGKET